MEKQPIEWQDHFTNTKERKIFTYNETKIPGLRMFGYHHTSRALAPLDIHYHKNCFEFTYVIQGNLDFSVNKQNYSLSGGDMYITFPNEIHDTGNKPMSLHKIYWFQLDISDPKHFLYMEPHTAKILIQQLCQLQDRVIQIKGLSKLLLDEIFSNISQISQINRASTAFLLSALLCQIVKNATCPAIHLTPDIKYISHYIQEHIYESLAIEELAKKISLSVSRFKQKFKQQIGISPRNYINFHKVETAKKLLQKGESVTDTAMKLNFSSSNYFSTVFHRYTSISPTEFIRHNIR